MVTRLFIAFGRGSVAALRGAVLFGLSAAALAVFAPHLLAFVAPWGWGTPQVVVGSRWLTNTYRRLAQKWVGVEIAEPYTPEPELPEPGPDGRYRRGRMRCAAGPVARARQVEWVLKDRATWRDMTWMLTAALPGAPLALPAVLAGYGFFGLICQPLSWSVWGPALERIADVRTSPWWAWEPVSARVPALDVLPAAASPAIGVVLTMAGLLAAAPLLRMHTSWSRLLLAPTERARLAQRVHRLTESRADIAEAQAADLRRIERDLHDGAQARLVAMGMTLGAMEELVRDNPAAKELLAKTRDTSARALQELRDLVRGIHPPVLAERGLGDALRALALDSTVPVVVTVDLPGRLEPPVESAVYFAVAEALANAVKHSGAERVRFDVRYEDGTLTAAVTDDGRGGATVTPGGGLHGIQRRLGTFDGVLALKSPQGGPTTVTMEIPCALSSPKTSTSSGTV